MITMIIVGVVCGFIGAALGYYIRKYILRRKRAKFIGMTKKERIFLSEYCKHDADVTAQLMKFMVNNKYGKCGGDE